MHLWIHLWPCWSRDFRISSSENHFAFLWLIDALLGTVSAQVPFANLERKSKTNPQRCDTFSDFFTRQNDKEDWKIQNIHLQSSLVSDYLLSLEHLHTHTAEATTGQDPEGSALMIVQFCHGSDNAKEFFYRPWKKAFLADFRELKSFSVFSIQEITIWFCLKACCVNKPHLCKCMLLYMQVFYYLYIDTYLYIHTATSAFAEKSEGLFIRE